MSSLHFHERSIGAPAFGVKIEDSGIRKYFHITFKRFPMCLWGKLKHRILQMI